MKGSSRLLRLFMMAAAVVICTGASGDYVMLTLAKPSATPYATVRYEVTQRGRATTATHRRNIPGHGEPLHAMGLMTKAESERFWKQLKALNFEELNQQAAGLVPEQRDPAVHGWRVNMTLDGISWSFQIFDTPNQPDPRYDQFVRLVMETVHRHGGLLHFRNVFIPKKRLGWINVVSVPVARVYVDGFDTRLESPLYGYEIEAGRRQIKLISTDGKVERLYEVKVEPGGTTVLRVDLR